jgi:hypothetical protein
VWRLALPASLDKDRDQSTAVSSKEHTGSYLLIKMSADFVTSTFLNKF